MPSSCTSDCRSEDGITIGLIDTIINSARLLRDRKLDSKDVLEALKDLDCDEDLEYVLHCAEHIVRSDAEKNFHEDKVSVD